MGWLVSQIGAREHYAVARGLQCHGALDRLFTDAWCYWGASLLRRGPAALQRYAGRRAADIPAKSVTAFNACALRAGLRRHPAGADARYRRFLRAGREFGERVARVLKHRPPDPEHSIFFGYDTGALEPVEWLASRGVFTIVDQIDPAIDGHAWASQEWMRWPAWEPEPASVPEEYYQRLRSEWAAASLVVVNSRWSRDSLVRQGVPSDKLAVVPCAYEAPAGPVVHRAGEGPLRVLWVGHVSLRKGIAYLLDAARLLVGTVDICVVGSIGISEAAVRSAPPNVRFVGAVPRERIGDMYCNADLFVFPTLSDGFGMTQLEAMSYGLPVVATANCGEVVTHEADGLIVPAGDSASLAAAIARLDADRALLREMSARARETVKNFSVGTVAKALLDCVATVRKQRGGCGVADRR